MDDVLSLFQDAYHAGPADSGAARERQQVSRYVSLQFEIVRFARAGLADVRPKVAPSLIERESGRADAARVMAEIVKLCVRVVDGVCQKMVPVAVEAVANGVSEFMEGGLEPLELV